MSPRPRLSGWSQCLLILGASSALAVLLISCVEVNRAVLAPPQIPGATYVGVEQCADCHGEKTRHFASATHARLGLTDAKVGDIGCEACHGPGSLHVQSHGAAGTIINPKKSPEACFQCHLDKRGQFSLPNTHPVLAGKVSCVDCHDVHAGDAVRGMAASLESRNDTCTKCHTEQKGPFVFEHRALREGCTVCHDPHGTINQKMLVARDANLCLRCHLVASRLAGPTAALGGNSIVAGAISQQPLDHTTSLMQGTCWSAGCHEAVHGSNASNHFFY
jgi:predicted CXXCH cytochrome family protein